MDQISLSTNQMVNDSLQKTKSLTNQEILSNGSSARNADVDIAHRNRSNELGKRKKSKNSTSSNACNNINVNQNLDDWLENSFRNSFGNINTDGYIPSVTPSSSHGGNKTTAVPDRYSKYTLSNVQTPYQFPTTFPSNMLYGKTMFSNSDFASLPPAVNLTNYNQRSNSNELLDGMEQRRFSDPCLAGNSDNDDSGNSDENSQKGPSTNDDNKKLFKTLLKQIHILHETNSKICRNLHENMVDIQALKHAPSWGLRHRRESISGLSTQSQPMGYFGTSSPAPTYNSGMYTPGMLTDVVREVKEAARVREDALLSRVTAIVNERAWSSDVNIKLCRDIEDLKIQLNVMRSERSETNARMMKMEDEIKSLRSLVAHILNTSRHIYQMNSNVMNEREFARTSSRQKRHSLSVNYGTINNDGPMIPNENEILTPLSHENRNHLPAYCDNLHGNGYVNGVYTTPENERNDNDIVQMEQETLKLRKELQDVLDSKQAADSKIIALENTVKSLKSKISQNESVNNSTKSITNENQTLLHGKSHNISQGKSSKGLSTSSITVTGPVTDL